MNYIAIQVEDKNILIDRTDFESLPKGYNFKLDKDGYAILYWYSKELRKTVSSRLHRWVMHEPVKLQVDHINGNKQDNRKENLRAVTHKQNKHNDGKRRLNHLGVKPSSLYKGVCMTQSGKWQAQIKINNRSKYLGQFNSQEEAAHIYNKAAKEAFGEYAFQNKIA